MANKEALARKLSAIADAIRAKSGGSSPLTLDGMAEAIGGIKTGRTVYQGVYSGDQSTRTITYTFPEPYGSTPNYLVAVYLETNSGNSYNTAASKGRINGVEKSFLHGSGSFNVAANSTSITISYTHGRVLRGSLLMFACF